MSIATQTPAAPVAGAGQPAGLPPLSPAGQLALDSGALGGSAPVEGETAGVEAGTPAVSPVVAIAITVFGLPAPQGSKSAFRNQHTGRIQQVESSKRVKPWREAVKTAARVEIDARPGWKPLDGPLVARMVFTMPKPSSAPKRRRTFPVARPDLSKILRSTEDALTDAGAIKDDARIVEYLRLAKVFPGEDVEALDTPGVRIEIRTVAS